MFVIMVSGDSMYKDNHINKKIMTVFIGVTLTALVMAFIWLNYIYTKFSIDNETYRETLSREIEETIASQTETILEQGDAIYQEERQELRSVLQYQGNLFRNYLFDYYFVIEENPESIQQKMQETVSLAEERLGIKISIFKEDQTLQIGEPVPVEGEANSFVEHEGSMYFHETIDSLGIDVYTYAEEHEYVANNLRQNFARYLELDPKLLIFDDHNESLKPSSELENVYSEDFEEHYFYQIRKSDLSGFYFGYYEDKEMVDDLLVQRNELFSGFLRNHIYEIIAYVILLLVVFIAMFRYLTQGSDQINDELNAAVVESYDHNRSIYDDPRLHGLPVAKGIDVIIRDSKKKQVELQTMIDQGKKQQKVQQVEILQLQRKIQTMMESDDNLADKDTLETIELSQFVHRMHKRWDPESELSMVGGRVEIKAKGDLLEKIFENLFTLTKGYHQSYQIELVKDRSQVQLFLNLVGFDDVDKTVIPKVRLLLQEMGGLLSRNNISPEMVNIVLSFSSP